MIAGLKWALFSAPTCGISSCRAVYSRAFGLKTAEKSQMPAEPMPDDYAIPVIDLGPCLADEPGALDRAAAELRHALTEIGFYSIVNHGVPSALVDEVYRQVARFHARPLGEKLKIKLDKHNTGYLPMMGDTLRTSVVANVTKPNMSEAFFMARDLAPDHPDVVSDRRFRSANQWPESLPGFREPLVEYCDALERLAQRLVRVYARALNLPATYFDAPFTDLQYKLRATHYPPRLQAPDDEFGIAPHTDTSFLTLLAPNDVPGLSFRTKPAIGSTSQPSPTRLSSTADSCCCVRPTTISSQRRTALLTALAASATRWHFFAMLRLIGRSPRYRPASAPDGRPDTRRPIIPTTWPGIRRRPTTYSTTRQKPRRRTVLDQSRRSDALWNALAKLTTIPASPPDAYAFIIDEAPWFTVTDDLPQYLRLASRARTLLKIPDRPIGSSAGRSVKGSSPSSEGTDESAVAVISQFAIPATRLDPPYDKGALGGSLSGIDPMMPFAPDADGCGACGADGPRQFAVSSLARQNSIAPGEKN